MNSIRILIGLAVLGTSLAQAQIIYVDATHGDAGNTAVAPSAGGGVFNPVDPQGPGGDGLWDVRAFANGGTIYQNASSGNTDNAQRLVTSVSGLPLDTYSVYAYFWSDTSTWRMGASLSDDLPDLPLYQFNPNSPGTTQYYIGTDASVGSSTLAPNPFTTDVLIAEGNRRLIQIDLGTVTGTSFDVFIDDDPNQADQNQRTWYDGVGYAVFVPEPSSMALLGLASAALLILRRRRF